MLSALRIDNPLLGTRTGQKTALLSGAQYSVKKWPRYIPTKYANSGRSLCWTVTTSLFSISDHYSSIAQHCAYASGSPCWSWARYYTTLWAL